MDAVANSSLFEHELNELWKSKVKYIFYLNKVLLFETSLENLDMRHFATIYKTTLVKQTMWLTYLWRLKRHTRGGVSLFDTITPDDLIMAFFPCIYFSPNNSYLFDGTWLTYKQRGMTEREINEAILQRSRERQKYYEICLKLFATVHDRGLRMIVENPESTIHYLHNNFPYKAKLVDRNRRKRGDYFAKPTQYWFENCEPTYGKSYVKEQKPKKSVCQLTGHTGNLCDEDRSMISPDYARAFICDFILGKKLEITERSLFDEL